MLKECLGRVGSSLSSVALYASAYAVPGLSSPGTTGIMKDFAPASRADPASMTTLCCLYLAMSLGHLQLQPGPVPISLSLGFLGIG